MGQNVQPKVKVHHKGILLGELKYADCRSADKSGAGVANGVSVLRHFINDVITRKNTAVFGKAGGKKRFAAFTD